MNVQVYGFNFLTWDCKMQGFIKTYKHIQPFTQLPNLLKDCLNITSSISCDSPKPKSTYPSIHVFSLLVKELNTDSTIRKHVTDLNIHEQYPHHTFTQLHHEFFSYFQLIHHGDAFSFGKALLRRSSCIVIIFYTLHIYIRSMRNRQNVLNIDIGL